MYTNEQISTALAEVVAEHGADHKYDPGRETEHKEAATLDYSYEDCIVGCTIQKIDPEMYARILQYEEDNFNGFTIDLAPEAVLKAFTKIQLRALKEAQAAQDVGATWGAAQIEFEEVIR